MGRPRKAKAKNSKLAGDALIANGGDTGLLDGVSAGGGEAVLPGGLAEALEAGNDWADIEERAECVRRTSESHAELWKNIHSVLKQRHTWHSKLDIMHRKATQELIPQHIMGEIQGSRPTGAAATAQGRSMAAEARSYTLTMRRVRQLDLQLHALLQEVREIEQNPDLSIDLNNNLDEVMRQAVMQDDPSQLRSFLETLPNRLSTQAARKIITDHHELSIMDIKSNIASCKREIAAQKKAERAAAKSQESEANASSAKPAAGAEKSLVVAATEGNTLQKDVI